MLDRIRKLRMEKDMRGGRMWHGEGRWGSKGNVGRRER